MTSDGGTGNDISFRQQYGIPADAEVIYTDGACPSNGTLQGRAGIGVFFGIDDPRNISSRLPGRHQTNQRAEIFAVLKALESLNMTPPTSLNVIILTDSDYVVKALTVWSAKWEKEGWKTAKRGEVVSKDLFKRARDMIVTLREKGVQIQFRHVPGHSGVWGNEQADSLAVRGAWMDEVEDKDWDESFNDEDLDAAIAEMQNV
jgi:ribonuclease HI